MESKSSNLQGAPQQLWFFSQARVALALVLLKTRPSGVSAPQYAQNLASRLRSLNEGWKVEARELQREVLRLQQELLLSRAATRASSSHEDAVDPASQDLFGPECLVDSTELQPDSGTPELLPSTPFQESAESSHPQERPEERPPQALAHLGFLQALCALHKVGGEGHGLEALWLPPEGRPGSLLEDSVTQLLAWVVKACKEPPLLGPVNLGLQACRVVAQATDLLCSQRPPSEDFRRRVETSLEELTEMLLHQDVLSQLPAENLSRCLMVLGSSSSRPILIRHLLTRLSGVADQLWRLLQAGKSSALQDFPLLQYQNSFHLFRCVETLLQSSQVPYRVEVGSDPTGFLAHLQQRVFLLSEEFPLFSMNMWMVGGLLTSAQL